jgi:uncharacterized membrane protein YjjB (DUF3815 family)
MTTITRYIPDRKFLAGGASGVIAWALSTFLGLDAELSMQIAAAAAAAVAYFVPPSVGDIIKRVDDTIIGLARRSPDSPASPE